MNIPMISVLMPLRDQARYAEAALRSVLRQTLQSIEVVAVDDGSQDDTPQIVARLARDDSRLRLLRQPARGIVAALNYAASQARGALLARMDGDDAVEPTWLERQRALLLRSSELVAVSCLVQPLGGVVIGEGWRRYLDWLNSCVTPEAIERELLIESPLAHPSVLMRRAAFEHVGGYRDFDGPEDYDLWLRLAAAGGRFAKVPQVLLQWRDSDGRLTRRDSRYRVEAFIRLKARYLARGPLVTNTDGRALLLWGAGRYGRMLARALEAEGVSIDAFVDVDPRKIGSTRRGRPVLAPEALQHYPRALVLAAVPVIEARALIRQHLQTRGYVEGRDFFICA